MKNFYYDIDAIHGKATLILPDKSEIKLDLMGIEKTTYNHLALVGAIHLIKHRADRDKSWDAIKSGKFGRIRSQNAPLVVKALALVKEIPLDRAKRAYKSLDLEKRRALRKDARIQSAILDIKRSKLNNGTNPVVDQILT